MAKEFEQVWRPAFGVSALSVADQSTLDDKLRMMSDPKLGQFVLFPSMGPDTPEDDSPDQSAKFDGIKTRVEMFGFSTDMLESPASRILRGA